LNISVRYFTSTDWIRPYPVFELGPGNKSPRCQHCNHGYPNE